jgi:hypothetical protein
MLDKSAFGMTVDFRCQLYWAKNSQIASEALFILSVSVGTEPILFLKEKPRCFRFLIGMMRLCISEGGSLEATGV